MIPILQLPRTLFATGAVAELPNELRMLNVEKPLLVTDRGVSGAGLVDKVTAVLEDASFACFDTVTENNVFADADGGADLYKSQGCDGVIGLGGGSVLDTAKCIAVLASNPGTIADYALDPEKPITGAAPIIAIPTTAGTGSEADIYAGIHVDSESPGVGLASHHVVPRVAILDVDMTRTLPPHVTAATGIDALSHCIEGYLSKEDVPFAKLVALDGLQRGIRSIERAVSDGESSEARSEMLLVAYAGGVAMSMGTGPAHAIALTCSEQGYPHGILSGIGIVMTLDLALSRLPDQRAALAGAMNFDSGRPLGPAFADLMRKLGLPTSLAELGYIVRDMDATVAAAHEHFLNGFALHHPTRDEYREMIQRSLEPRPAEVWSPGSSGDRLTTNL